APTVRSPYMVRAPVCPETARVNRVTWPVAPPTPLPVDPFNVRLFASTTVMVHVPFALVLTRCPRIVTRSPVAYPCAVTCTLIGDAFVDETSALGGVPSRMKLVLAGKSI